MADSIGPSNLTDNLDDDQKERLLKILRKEEMAASNFQDSELLNHRSDSLDYYDREPYGDEQEGSSRIVTSEYADTVESIMPSMMRVFTGNEASVEFSPTGPNQEKAAEEASEYVPHVLMVKNEGYRILYWFLKDALMYRLSGATVDLEDYEDERTQPFSGLTQEQLNVASALAEAKDADITIEQTEDLAAVPGEPSQQPIEGGIPQSAPKPTFSGTVTVTRKAKKVTVDNIASEDILFTPTARTQEDASFLGFRKKTTASELVALGLPWEDVQLLKSDRPISPEETQRNSAAIVTAPERTGDDDSERTLWLIVAYVRWADENDGKSKMWRVVYAHARGEITSLVEAQEWKGPASISLASAILMSHVIVGRSLFDQVKDLQEIGSVLTRGLLNNLYQVNTPRPVVSDQVNLDSLLDWVPGAPIRLKAGAKPGDNHVAWLQVPSVLANAQAALEYFQTVRENRTGIVRNTQGIEGKTLQNDTLGGMQMMMGAAQQRIELIARTLAETAVKRLYRLIYRAIKRAATGPIQFWNGQAMGSVDPTQWPDDLELTVNVGAGTRDQAMQGLTAVAAAQEKLLLLQGNQPTGPFVTAENVANLAQRMQETLGYRTPGLFFQPPEKVMQQPPQQPQQSPEMAKVQAQIQADQAKMVADAQHKQQQLAADTQHKQQQAQIDFQITREKAALDLQVAREKAAQELQLAREKAALDAELKRQELAQEGQLKVLEIATDAHVDTRLQEQQVGNE